jgi:putative ABC transport system ATP-binding protein
MSVAAFRLTGVSKNYLTGQTALPVLRHLSLEIPNGQFAAIMGPSGSGKSTLLNLLGCLDVPSEGTVDVLGHNVSALDDNALSDLRRKAIGFVFQSFHLLPSYDALENVAMPLAYADAKNRWGRAKRLLNDVGLSHRLHHRPSMLSGGEQQRVAIARALANNASILLADEPTGALDQDNGHKILDLLDALHRGGRTVVMVTHDSHVAERAERIIEMVDGRIRSDRGMRRR